MQRCQVTSHILMLELMPFNPCSGPSTLPSKPPHRTLSSSSCSTRPNLRTSEPYPFMLPQRSRSNEPMRRIAPLPLSVSLLQSSQTPCSFSCCLLSPHTSTPNPPQSHRAPSWTSCAVAAHPPLPPTPHVPGCSDREDYPISIRRALRRPAAALHEDTARRATRRDGV